MLIITVIDNPDIHLLVTLEWDTGRIPRPGFTYKHIIYNRWKLCHFLVCLKEVSDVSERGVLQQELAHFFLSFFFVLLHESK